MNDQETDYKTLIILKKLQLCTCKYKIQEVRNAKFVPSNAFEDELKETLQDEVMEDEDGITYSYHLDLE